MWNKGPNKIVCTFEVPDSDDAGHGAGHEDVLLQLLQTENLVLYLVYLYHEGDLHR